MKKYLIAGMVLMLATANSFGQSFMHGVGLNIFVATAPGGKAAVNEGITWSPRFNFIEQDNMSVSVGIPLTVGASFSYSADYNSYYGSSSNSSFSVMINAPLIINLNMGAGATKETESRFGYFVGGGFGYHYGSYNISDAINYDNGDYTTGKLNTFGPVGNAGVRFAVGRHTHNVEVRLQYMKGLNDSKANIYGAGAAFNF